MTECQKCKALSGDDWTQCGGSCPMPGSPHYDPHARLQSRPKDASFSAFLMWARGQGHDIANCWSDEACGWLCLNPVTADLWAEWNAVVKPIDMVLHCPACGLQHIDGPEGEAHLHVARVDEDAPDAEPWTNPPHRSHLCAGCGHVWRPADVPTNGVQAVQTKGKHDTRLGSECRDEMCACRGGPCAECTDGQRVAAETMRGAELARLQALLNAPELHDFAKGVTLEAAHQRERWGADHDAGKTPPDWFWLIGYLGGKALHHHAMGNTEKALHHTISTAAACANWHAAISGTDNTMRPGIDPVARGVDDAEADRKSRHAAAAPWLV